MVNYDKNDPLRSVDAKYVAVNQPFERFYEKEDRRSFTKVPTSASIRCDPFK
jgi:hypothetical protein